ncbi:MAG: alpha-2-macroglobulin family protein [Myxococcota bacterium]
MLAIEQSGLRAAVPFRIKDGVARVRFTPQSNLGPGVELTAWTNPKRDPGSVLRAYAHAPVRDRVLSVAVHAARRARPGTTLPIEIAVTDHAGSPTRARLAVWVVDDGLHALRRPPWPDLGAIFNPARPWEHATTDSVDDLIRSSIFGRRARRSPRVRQAKAMVKGSLGEPDERRDFEPVPLFAGDVGTDAEGRATLSLDLPDDLTRFEVFAVASAERTAEPGAPVYFGYGTAEIRVTSPLNVRVALPRVLRPGDLADVAALVHAPADGEVVVAMALPDPTLVPRGPTDRRVAVSAGQVARVPFRVRAAQPGEPRVALTARFIPRGDGTQRDSSVERRVPIAMERTATERAAVYGVLAQDKPVAIPVRIPDGARKDHGGVSVSTLSTATGQLDDAADYLIEYPYGCLEQTSSRLLPLVALRGLAGRLKVPEAKVAAMAEAAIARIVSMQLGSGRLGYWPDADHPAGFSEGYALWVLHMAKQAGLAVPAKALRRADDAIAEWAADAVGNDERDAGPRLLQSAMMLMALDNDAPEAAVARLYERRAELSFSAAAMLAMTMHSRDAEDSRLSELRETISAAIESRPGRAHVVAPTGGYWLRDFDSGARDDALAILTLMQLAPEDGRITKLVAGLRERRRAGRWRNTQENAFALLALSRYAAAHEARVPDNEVRAWVGGHLALEAEHRGFEASPQHGTVPMAAIAPALGAARTTPVVIERKGVGPVHYRLGVQWAVDAPPARAQGLRLDTKLESADGEAVTRLQAGTRYAVDVRLSTSAPQHHIAVEIPLPAGVEAVHPRLGRGGRANTGGFSLAKTPWLSHMERRADRLVLFFDELPPGTVHHEVVVFAATPGEYTMPAAVAEAMYEPETRARETPRRIVVEAPP